MLDQLPNQTISNSVSGIEKFAPAKLPVFEKLVWSVVDVARELKVSSRYVYKLVSNDEIPYAKVGRLVRFSPVRVFEWLEKGGTR